MESGEKIFEGETPSKKVKENPCALTSLKKFSIVVADTGKFNEIEKYKPQDATTNPTLILEAAKSPEYQNLIDQSIKQAIQSFQKEDHRNQQKNIMQGRQINSMKSRNSRIMRKKLNLLITKTSQTNNRTEQLCVNFGIEILKLVPGYVSTEVDARLSFDTKATIEKAKKLIQLYEQAGIKKDRILIKIAATWEGIEAAKALKKEQIQTNLTLIFNYHQAIACAKNRVRLISPFVGRVLDYYKVKNPNEEYKNEKHPGVILVKNIYNYFKKYRHDTIIMAASIRLLEECSELCGVDRFTIPPKVLEDLQSQQDVEYPQVLSVQEAIKQDIKEVHIDEKTFRWELNNDSMATEKLSEGIRKFADDIVKLEALIERKLSELQ